MRAPYQEAEVLCDACIDSCCHGPIQGTFGCMTGATRSTSSVVSPFKCCPFDMDVVMKVIWDSRQYEEISFDLLAKTALDKNR